MIKDFVILSKKYLIILCLLLILFLFFKFSFMDSILNVDKNVMGFVQNNVVRKELTIFFKVFTNFGDVIFFAIMILLLFMFCRKKNVFLSVFFNLFIVYVFSVIYKNIFRRERPLYNLIDKPKDFSFPSGHTMCSVAFYGFLIFLILKFVKDKFLKIVLTSLCVLSVLIIAFSRIYLNVHYFSDVVCGAILGFICLLMFVNYVRIKNII